jgi:hypothetical protein
VWLVLCEDHDLAARWAYAGLLSRGLAPLELITASTLAASQRWVHRVNSTSSDVEIRLPGGRTLDSRRVRGYLNRLTLGWNPLVSAARQPDQEYARGEWYSFLVSSLHCLGGVGANPPHGQGLSGRWRHPSEWMVLAARAGLATAACTVPAEAMGPHLGTASRRTLIVVGDQVMGAGHDPRLAVAARRLAELSGAAILGVELDFEPDTGWRFVGATPQPDLRLGGPALLDALARHLRGLPAMQP